MTAEQIVNELGGRGRMALCPVHEREGSTPSLAVTEKGGRVLVHCHGGCPQDAVIEALKARGLWESEGPKSRIVAEYSYTNESGELLYQVVREEPKRFLQRYPDARGDWIWKKHADQVLYRLPEALDAPIVFVVEGEKDVETLREHGFVATTNAGGAKSAWLPSFTETLRGREVNIIPDNDKPGWERALKISRALLGTAARIRIFDLPKDTKDVSDWFTAGHSECELIAMLEGVHAV